MSTCRLTQITALNFNVTLCDPYAAIICMRGMAQNEIPTPTPQKIEFQAPCSARKPSSTVS